MNVEKYEVKQIDISQTRQMLEIINGVVPILNQKEHSQLLLFCAKVLKRYENEKYPDTLERVEAE